jgi:hypothetical protein
MKKETLEEASRNEFVTTPKWQQERSYSEEDLEEAFKSGFTNCYKNKNLTFGEWFEQFKKK